MPGSHGKAQLSIEFLIYVSISLAALAGSLYAANGIAARYHKSIGESEMQNLAIDIDSSVGYADSMFYAYVPKSICSCSPVHSSILCNGSLTQLSADISIGKSVCDYSGRVEDLHLQYMLNGTYRLGASP